jgi:cytochrome c556
MKQMRIRPVALSAALLVALSASTSMQIFASDANEDAIKEIMKVYHKAPKGVDTVSKKAAEGKATPDELKKLVAAYRTLATTKPPRGDEASWKSKTATLLSAAEEMQQGKPDGVAKYKKAVNCKACHSEHKPE